MSGTAQKAAQKTAQKICTENTPVASDRQACNGGFSILKIKNTKLIFQKQNANITKTFIQYSILTNQTKRRKEVKKYGKVKIGKGK